MQRCARFAWSRPSQLLVGTAFDCENGAGAQQRQGRVQEGTQMCSRHHAQKCTWGKPSCRNVQVGEPGGPLGVQLR